tara:strand:+ start:1814 stop:2296 length:483 start_codon:yes stop_codon:yes gene_type:complete
MMPGIVSHRHLHRQNPARGQSADQSRQQVLMVRQPVERGVGEDQVHRTRRAPATDVSQHPVDIVLALCRLGEHGSAGVQSVHHGRGMAALQQGGMLSRPTAQIPDLAGVQSRRQAQQQIQGGAIALVIETAVLSGIPYGGGVGHGRLASVRDSNGTASQA